MAWWERYQAWQLESRARWVATNVVLRAVIVFFFSFLIGSSSQKALVVTVTFIAVAAPLWWLWAYPRERAKKDPTSAPVPTTQA